MADHRPDSLKPDDGDHWLVRPATLRGLWAGFAAVLALTVAAQWLVPIKGKFGPDGWPAFGALFGFASCVAMVVFARALGALLKRKDDYYDDE